MNLKTLGETKQQLLSCVRMRSWVGKVSTAERFGMPVAKRPLL